MANRRPERDARWGTPTDPLKFYRRDYALQAHCRRASCKHARELHVALLLRIFGAEATLGQIAARLRCSQCGMRGARIECRHHGPTSSDWR